MTDKQTYALQLADELDNTPDIQARAWSIATQLRWMRAENETLKVDRDELLNTLKVATWMLEREHIDDLKTQVIEMCYATVRKVEGDKSG